MSKIRIKIKSMLNKLSPKSDSPKKSDKKIIHTTNTSKKHATWNKSCSNASRRNTQENTTQIQPRTYIENIRRLECIAINNIIESKLYVNEIFILSFKNDPRTVNSLFKRIYINYTVKLINPTV